MITTNATAASSAAQLLRGADLVLVQGRVWTGEPYAPPGQKARPAAFAEAVAIANGRILALGTSQEMLAYTGPNTQVLNLEGRLAVPGFIDDHVHFVQGGFQLLEVDLKDTRSEAQFVERIAEKARSLKAGRWMEGGNWDEEAWPDAKLPTRWLIDSVTPNNPVFLSRYDGHAALANSAALKLSGVTKETPTHRAVSSYAIP
jgi:predicted amidohydrolase YtcJ